MAAAVEDKSHVRFRCRMVCWTSFKVKPIKFDPEYFKYLVYQEEVAPDTGAHHLQGFSIFKKPLGLEKIRELLDDPAVHVEKIHKKSTPAKAAEYCKKEKSRFPGGLHDEQGVLLGQGARTDLTAVKEAIEAGMAPVDLRWDDNYIETVSRSDRFVDQLYSDKLEREGKKALSDKMAEVELRPWQDELYLAMQDKPDDRTVNWVFDATGNSGKSFLARYFVVNLKALLLSPGRYQDIAYIYSQNLDKHVVMFDCSRSMQKEEKQRDPLDSSYQLAEAIKNGVVLSTKYSSKTCYCSETHVIFFSNQEPDYKKLSHDRWLIWRLDDQQKLVKQKLSKTGQLEEVIEIPE